MVYLGSLGEYELIAFNDINFPMNVEWNKKLVKEDPARLTKLRWHEQIEVKYFLSGGAEIECDSNVFIAETGDIVVINPCERHGTRYLYGNPEYHLIMVDPRLLRSYESDVLDMKYLLPYVGGRIKFNTFIHGNDAIRATLLRLFDELAGRSEAYELMSKGLLYILFAQLFRDEAREINDGYSMEYTKRFGKRLEPVFLRIKQAYSEEINVDSLAGLCKMSVSHFCRTFKKMTGATPVQYINGYRVNKAEILLRTTGMTVFEIAQMTGFRDECYFSRLFRRMKGFTPSSVREK